MIKNVLLYACLFANLTWGYAQTDSYANRQVKKLTDALHFYEKIAAGEWSYFSCDSCLSPGQKSLLNVPLRKNLLLTGDLQVSTNTGSDSMDIHLLNALKRFQLRNGLTSDGVLGPKTLDAMNTPLSVRINQLKNNIDHWKALSDTIPEPYILINIPDFTLSIIENGSLVKSTKVIVGRLTNPTPILSSKIHSIVTNPSWTVPNSIATKEIIPMLRKDPNYLRRNNMKVYSYQKKQKVEVNADFINWNSVSTKNFRYIFEQVPGSWNALGRIKFLFNNTHNVYLHDTQDKYLFSHTKRTYSHGCVRVEKPLELAAWLLKKDVIEVEHLILASKDSKTIALQNEITVKIDYFTSWVDEHGCLQFRSDVYNKEAF